jgi:hypothetical protein
MQAAVMDGNKFNTRCREAGEQRLEILDECEVRRAPSPPNAAAALPSAAPLACALAAAHSAATLLYVQSCGARRVSVLTHAGGALIAHHPTARPCWRPAALEGGSSPLRLLATHQ